MSNRPASAQLEKLLSWPENRTCMVTGCSQVTKYFFQWTCCLTYVWGSEVQLILSKQHFWSHSIFNTTIIIIRISKVSSIHTSFALRYTNLSWFMFLYLSSIVLRINFYCLDIVLIHWIVLKNLTLLQEREHLIGHVLLSNIKSFFSIFPNVTWIL